MCNTQRRTNATWDSRWAVMKETCLYFYESKESRVIENSFVISDVRLLVLEQVSSGWPAILVSATVCSASFPWRIHSASSSHVYLAYSSLMLLVPFNPPPCCSCNISSSIISHRNSGLSLTPFCVFFIINASATSTLLD